MQYKVSEQLRPAVPYKRLPWTVLVAAGVAFFSAGDPGTASAQVKTALSGSAGSSSAGTATASNAQTGFTATSIPDFRPTRYGPGGRSRFTEESGLFRPYPLVSRPVYRTEIGVQPIRRMTFSLGYVSYSGYGAYYY